jgi:ferrochelatase
MKFTIVPAFYNKPDYLQNFDSIKGHLEGLTTIIYYFLPRYSRRHIRKTDITIVK